MTTTTHPRLLTLDHAQALAVDLVGWLGATPGDQDAVNQTLSRWATELGPTHFAQVCMAAVSLTFGECIRHVAPDQWPADPMGFHQPTEGENQ